MIWALIILAILALVWWIGDRLNRYPPLDPAERERRAQNEGGMFGSNGSVSGATLRHTDPLERAEVKTRTEHDLAAELRAWCERHGYNWRADPRELMMDPTLSPEQFNWLHAFVKAGETFEGK